MNMQKKIESYLRVAPKPPASDALLGKLQTDISLRPTRTYRSSLRKWFAPTGRSVSPWRVAVAALITVAVLLPLGYGATKLIKRFVAISQLPTITVDFPGSGTLSPDGKQFAGITWDSELAVIDISTGEQTNLGKGFYGRVVWSADGSEIAVKKQGGDKEQRGLLAVSARTGDTRSLARGLGHFEDWSKDGKFILFVRSANRTVYSVILVNLE
ncbi:MAG: hypothetical protein U9Q07_05915, partial [Planctomycetota bacterium]|nr:hypothetical protein [Planctomycetota bacterium]